MLNAGAGKAMPTPKCGGGEISWSIDATRLAHIKHEIAAGAYPTPEQIDGAVAALFAEVALRPDCQQRAG